MSGGGCCPIVSVETQTETEDPEIGEPPPMTETDRLDCPAEEDDPGGPQEANRRNKETKGV